ncbi:BLUF domain-containing protein [Brevundimonas sp. Root1423]|uniref:BLUF domain-containing protein n=1 Tax=Brevundimonas sp. Root1423 TaxID=1736462 RepID=UPI0006F65A0E|nr:BLUF domain-containing protein [Brevundimonas sp. Root1423]KQY75392.1 hypothetical protein ASD25_12720 [Brevundimonas sp. Root1423]
MTENLERLVYCSTAAVPTDSLVMIADILSVSQRNNDRDGVTGALAISEGWFLQVLEGRPDALDALLRRLETDRRHKDLIVLARSRVAARLFGSWSMKSARVTPDIADDLRTLINECRTSPVDATAALLRLVSGDQPSR